MKHIGFRIEEGLYEYLRKEAEKKHASLSWYLRDIIYQFMLERDDQNS